MVIRGGGADRVATPPGKPHGALDDRRRLRVADLGLHRRAQRSGVHDRPGGEQLLAGVAGSPVAVVSERLSRPAGALDRDCDLPRHRGAVDAHPAVHPASARRRRRRPFGRQPAAGLPPAGSGFCDSVARGDRGRAARRGGAGHADSAVAGGFRGPAAGTRPDVSHRSGGDRGARSGGRNRRGAGAGVAVADLLRDLGRLHRHPHRLSAGDLANASGSFERRGHADIHHARTERPRRASRRVAGGAQRPDARTRLPSCGIGRVRRRGRRAVRCCPTHRPAGE